MASISVAMVLSSAFGFWPISNTEVWGFVTGGVCVWLTVRESVLNFPIGLANNVLFFVLFLHGALYADMALQVVYFGLGIYGWVHWLRGGTAGTALRVTRSERWEWMAALAFVVIGTIAMREVLIAVNGASPLWDALTTALSLAAQYLLCRKRIEHWFFWIAADLIYLPLYVSRGLFLTAVLYAVFLVMCFIGLRSWKRSLSAAGKPNSLP